MGYKGRCGNTYLDVRVAGVDCSDEAEVRLRVLPINHFVGRASFVQGWSILICGFLRGRVVG